MVRHPRTSAKILQEKARKMSPHQTPALRVAAQMSKEVTEKNEEKTTKRSRVGIAMIKNLVKNLPKNRIGAGICTGKGKGNLHRGDAKIRRALKQGRVWKVAWSIFLYHRIDDGNEGGVYLLIDGLRDLLAWRVELNVCNKMRLRNHWLRLYTFSRLLIYCECH